jgi:hypothetical protein
MLGRVGPVQLGIKNPSVGREVLSEDEAFLGGPSVWDEGRRIRWQRERTWSKLSHPSRRHHSCNIGPTTEGLLPMECDSDVTLFDDDDNPVVARPFLLTRFGKCVLPTELYTDDGTRIRCLDHLKRLYRCADSGRFLHERPRQRADDN